MVKKIGVGLQVRANVWARFKALVEQEGVTLNFGLERLLIRTINEGEIPGLERMRLDEQRENEKYGEATPVYDGEQAVKSPSAGRRKAITSPSE